MFPVLFYKYKFIWLVFVEHVMGNSNSNRDSGWSFTFRHAHLARGEEMTLSLNIHIKMSLKWTNIINLECFGDVLMTQSFIILKMFINALLNYLKIETFIKSSNSLLITGLIHATKYFTKKKVIMWWTLLAVLGDLRWGNSCRQNSV